MPRTIVRISVSSDGQGYRLLAHGVGIPVLDKGNAIAGLWDRWLSRFAAEPERTGDTVTFYLRNEEGERVEDLN
jgi:hypothetical protein